MNLLWTIACSLSVQLIILRTSSVLNLSRSLSRHSLQPSPFNATGLSSVEKAALRTPSIPSQSHGLLGQTEGTSLARATSCFILGQRNIDMIDSYSCKDTPMMTIIKCRDYKTCKMYNAKAVLYLSAHQMWISRTVLPGNSQVKCECIDRPLQVENVWKQHVTCDLHLCTWLFTRYTFGQKLKCVKLKLLFVSLPVKSWEQLVILCSEQDATIQIWSHFWVDYSQSCRHQAWNRNACSSSLCLWKVRNARPFSALNRTQF